MKILHVIPSVALADGGPSRAIRLIAGGLVARGIEVDVVSTDAGMDTRKGDSCYEILADEFRPARLLLFPVNIGFYKISLQLRDWLRAHVRNYDAVHIHALFSWSSTVAARAAIKASVPYIIRPLGTLNRYGIVHHRPLLKMLSLKLIESRLLSRAAYVHFTDSSEADEAALLELDYRAAVIPLGVEDFQHEGNNPMIVMYPELQGKRVILFLSRIAEKKNITGLLKAFRIVQDRFPETRLVIAGDGQLSLVEKLRQLVDTLGLGKTVIWAGYVDGPHKHALFDGAWMFVLPSFSENFGISVAEALSAGLPCVLGEGVALSRSVAESGAGISVDTSAESIAAGIDKILQNDSLHASMEHNALTLAQREYSIPAMSAALQDLYVESIKGKSSL